MNNTFEIYRTTGNLTVIAVVEYVENGYVARLCVNSGKNALVVNPITRRVDYVDSLRRREVDRAAISFLESASRAYPALAEAFEETLSLIE